METWFLNHAFGLSLSVLLLGLPGPLGAWTPTINRTDSVTAGIYFSTAGHEVNELENNESSTSHSSERLSPSQRDILLTHTAGTEAFRDTEQTQSFTETSSRSPVALSLLTETLASTLVVATTEASISSITTTSSSSIATTSSSSNSPTRSTSRASTIISGSSSTSTTTSSSGTSTTRTGSSTSSSSTSGSSSGNSSRSSTTVASSDSSSSDSSITASSSSSISSSSSRSSSGNGSRSSTTVASSSTSSSDSSSSDSSITASSSSSISSGNGSRSSTTVASSSTSSSDSSSSDSSITASSSSSSGNGSRSSTTVASSSTSSSDSSSSDSSITVSSSSSSGNGSRSSTTVASSSTSSSNSSSSNSSITTRTSSSISSSSSTSTDQKWIVNTDPVSNTSSILPLEPNSWMLNEEARMPQDSPDTTLRHGDASSSMSDISVHTDSTYTSTAISRAGERTLLSVTSSSSSSNSTSSAFTKNSSSHHYTWGISASTVETEDYTPSTRTNSDTTDHHMTHSMKGFFSESGTPEWSRGFPGLNEQTNVTQHQIVSTSEETSKLTPPLRVTELSTDLSQVSVSSTTPITSSAEGSTSISGTNQEMSSSHQTSTESSAGDNSSTSSRLKGAPVQTTEQSVGLGVTTGLPTVSSGTPEWTESLTDTPVPLTNILITTIPVTVTERQHITEENTFKATVTSTNTVATSATSTLPETSSSQFISMISSSSPGSSTEATTLFSTASTSISTQAVQTSAKPPTHNTLSSQTQEPTAGMAIPTNPTKLQTETSTVTQAVPSVYSQTFTPTYPQSPPARSTVAPQTTGKQMDRGTTTLETTKSPADITSTSAPLPPRNPCVSNPCMNGGMCVSSRGHQFTCHCQQAWTGPTCNQDVDECEKDPCPIGSRCVNTAGSFSCECPLGFNLEDGRTCTTAKTFLGTFSVNRQPHDPVVFKSTMVHEIQREIIHLLNASLSALRGYSRSLLSKKEEDGVHISAVNMFSISTNVSSTEVYNSIQMSLSNCSSSLAHCWMVLQHKITYRVESLCVAQKTQCDAERSTCTDDSGTARCQCLPGYYKHNPDDLSCLECGDGFKLENGTCVPCMFGFGGFNCGNFYKLIAVVVSPAGGGLLLILIIALIVTCCKKDKNDINKIIFKSGDVQMSPYADFPKSNRISMEWGRETIEMQENGSTKNLLQMTDIYYSPALRNADLERNGLYAFPGLPGSRHSCIYPAQWNPSFISDDSRRRDYF